tara:strand:- start:1385 stop:2371 length:987 start_codon:yes stop_codon:yes gene_type:complete
MPLPAALAGVAKVGAIIGKGAVAAGKGIAAGAKAGAKAGSRTVSGSAKSAKNLKISVGKIRSVLNKRTKRLSNLKKINVRDQNKLLSLRKKQKAEKKLESPLKGIAALSPIKGLAKIGSKVADFFKFLLLGIGFNALWENAGKIAEIMGDFYKRLVSWWDNPQNKKLRDNIKKGLDKVDTKKLVEQFKQLKELSDELRVRLAPIFEKDNVLLNKKGEIDPKTFIEDEDNPDETLRFGETFSSEDDLSVGPTDDEERINKYYVDQNGHVRLKEDNSRPWGSRFINKEGLERKDYLKFNPVKKNDNLSSLNSNGSKKNKMIIVKQPIIYT